MLRRMTNNRFPVILDPTLLARELANDHLLIVDLSARDIYDRHHVPGAVHVDYGQITVIRGETLGLLPAAPALAEILSAIGMRRECHVVAYDEEGGNKAGRFLWTLEVCGHTHYSLLDGGLAAWLSSGLPTESQARPVTPSHYPVHYHPEVIADRDYVRAHLHEPDHVLVDARGAEEYSGREKRALHRGHIPGAINIDWLSCLAPDRDKRLKSLAEIKRMYHAAGVTPDKTVITYCHSHRRSAHTFVVLRALGYPKLKGYPGSWTDWGNCPELPVESAVS